MNIISKNFYIKEPIKRSTEIKKSQERTLLSFLGKKSEDKFQISSPSGSGETKVTKTKGNKEGNLFIISAPSGTGKGTIISQILKSIPGIKLSVSATTRKPRPNEIDNVHYHFIDKPKFQKLIDRNQFIEWAEVYKDQFYGTLRNPVHNQTKSGKDIILEIGASAHDLIKNKMPKAISIFIAPPSFEELRKRLTNRKTESQDKIEERLAKAKEELTFQDKFDHIVINDDLDTAVQEVKEIILEARANKNSEKPLKNDFLSA